MARPRFYKDVSVAPPDDASLQRVLLDGKPVKTPGGAVLAVPYDRLAHAIADEWRAQDTQIRPETMILTKLANTAIDRVTSNSANAREQLLTVARRDVVCYRAEFPADLVQRQDAVWNSLLDWVRGRFGAALCVAKGITFVEQEPDAIAALDAALLERDAFFLAALYAAAALLGSLAIALALAECRLTPDEAFAAANLDRVYQAERWGWDDQAAAQATAERAELI